MGVGVAGGPGMQPFPGSQVGNGLLGVTRHCIVLREGCQNGAALAPRSAKGGGHATGPYFHVKALFSQQVHVGCRRQVLAVGRFGVGPDFLMKVGKPLPVAVDPLHGRCLGLPNRCHIIAPKCGRVAE